MNHKCNSQRSSADSLATDPKFMPDTALHGETLSWLSNQKITIKQERFLAAEARKFALEEAELQVKQLERFKEQLHQSNSSQPERQKSETEKPGSEIAPLSRYISGRKPKSAREHFACLYLAMLHAKPTQLQDLWRGPLEEALEAEKERHAKSYGKMSMPLRAWRAQIGKLLACVETAIHSRRDDFDARIKLHIDEIDKLRIELKSPLNKQIDGIFAVVSKIASQTRMAVDGEKAELDRQKTLHRATLKELEALGQRARYNQLESITAKYGGIDKLLDFAKSRPRSIAAFKDWHRDLERELRRLSDAVESPIIAKLSRLIAENSLVAQKLFDSYGETSSLEIRRHAQTILFNLNDDRELILNRDMLRNAIRLLTQIVVDPESGKLGKQVPLTDRDIDLLKTLHKLGASPLNVIPAKMVFIELGLPPDTKHAFDRLKSTGYVDSHKGRGYFPTPDGDELIIEVSSRK